VPLSIQSDETETFNRERVRLSILLLAPQIFQQVCPTDQKFSLAAFESFFLAPGIHYAMHGGHSAQCREITFAENGSDLFGV
jgi:hypothetical protein